MRSKFLSSRKMHSHFQVIKDDNLLYSGWQVVDDVGDVLVVGVGVAAQPQVGHARARAHVTRGRDAARWRGLDVALDRVCRA
jgi:hypothetical protein